ncbi:DinB family protein [Amycolatopsis panacis]|uniref:DinB family protein n=1 Tax=Amycolatopsis panacis TaxID=2340917 RepID=A0A419I7M1_9PSEU|nr:DinB family protein [Amycolatopsis panacis]RJQ87714.1 DinB family protein [Amycolatopsis panacis]
MTTAPATHHGERADLLAELAAARTALTGAAQGLTDAQAGETPTVSELCLGGLIKHVAQVEENWLRFTVEGPTALTYALPEGVTWGDIAAGTARELPQWMIEHAERFRMQPGETLADVLEHYKQVAAHSEEIINAHTDLSATHPLPDAPWHEPGAAHSVRRVLLHVIAETAQHAGHADIIRETLDGRKAG